MTRAPSPRSPQTAALATIRRDGWTIERQTAFLEALAAGSSVAGAAQQVGMSRQAAYALRARLRGEPFDQAWQVATRCRFDELLDAALDRALNGVEVPHFHKGHVVHLTRRYDERLTVALLKARGALGEGRSAPVGHPSRGYGRDEFARLLERVAEGPETWEAEIEADYAALLAHDAAGGDAGAAEQAADGSRAGQDAAPRPE
jgi:hypothetical protein